MQARMHIQDVARSFKHSGQSLGAGAGGTRLPWVLVRVYAGLQTSSLAVR